MGATQSSDGTPHTRSLRAIDTQADDLQERIRTHRLAADNQLVFAQRALDGGDRESAVSIMRSHHQTTSHVKTIEGMLSNLLHHKHALETKLMTAETMSVMSKTARTLGKQTLNTSDIDSMMIAADEMHEDAAQLGMAMGAVDHAADDEALLSKLCTSEKARSAPQTSSLATPDEELEALLEATLVELGLPKAPTHALKCTQPPPPAYSTTSMVM